MSEYEVLNAVHNMCISSLSPDVFEKWESVKAQLILNRKNIKDSKTYHVPDLLKWIFDECFEYGPEGLNMKDEYSGKPWHEIIESYKQKTDK